jgi:hypothetical protein
MGWEMNGIADNMQALDRLEEKSTTSVYTSLTERL